MSKRRYLKNGQRYEFFLETFAPQELLIWWFMPKILIRHIFSKNHLRKAQHMSKDGKFKSKPLPWNGALGGQKFQRQIRISDRFLDIAVFSHFEICNRVWKTYRDGKYLPSAGKKVPFLPVDT